MPRRISVLALLLVGLVRPAVAEEARWNVNLQLGPNFVVAQPANQRAENNVSVTAFDLRIAVEYQPIQRVGVEVAYNPDVLFRSIGVLTQQNFLVGARVRPWLDKQGGFLLPKTDKHVNFISDMWVDAHLGVSVSSATRFVYDVGVGTRLPLMWPIQLGLFARWQHLIAPSDGSSFMQVVFGLHVSAGFQSFHKEPDADSDGVPDARDVCPDTAREAKVNEVGCEVKPETKAPPPKCSDTDLDGVCDGHDACPDTPVGTRVDEKGCPPGVEPPSSDSL